MPLTNRFYGSTSVGAGRTIQDFGLCDTTGTYVFTAKVRQKGLLTATFFSPDSEPSARVLKAIQAWTADIPAAKWTALAVADTARDALSTFANQHGLVNVTLLSDHGLYQTRNWGVSRLPTTLLIAGKTGQILNQFHGDDPADLAAMKDTLNGEVAKLIAAEEAAKEAARVAEEAKKAAEAAAAAAKPAEPAKV